MKHVVERLRDALDGEPKLAPDPDDVLGAADEIEELRARVEELEGALEEIDDRCAGEVTALAMDVQEILRSALP